MKTRFHLSLTLLLCGLLLLVPLLAWAAPGAKKTAAKSTPGVEAAQTLTMITGVAISPLLGVGAVGAWKYFQAEKEERAKLPWFAQPLFWIPALLLVGAVFVKDTLGIALPTAAKKPLDVAETIENKISGLVATGAFVPLIAAFFTSDASVTTAMSVPGPMFAMVGVSSVANLLLLPFAMIAFFVVWIVAHAINVLILISPFTTVDASLKGLRAALLASVTITGFANPMIGAIWAGVIILVCYFLAGWAFRLAVFGTVFTWDYATFRRLRFHPDAKANWMFLGCVMDKIPVRTYGRLSQNEKGDLIFRYRPWLFLAEREFILPAAEYAVGRGLFYSEVVAVKGGETKAIFTLPPRYCTHEEALAQASGLAGVRDVGMLKGLKSIWNFIRELCGFGSKYADPSAV